MTDITFVVMVMIAILSALAAGGVAFGGFGGSSSKRLRRRVDAVRGRAGGTSGAHSGRGAGIASVRRDEGGGVAVLERLTKALLPRQDVLRARLARTGRRIPLGSYMVANLGLFVLTLAVDRFAIGFSGPVGAAIGIAVGLGVPHWIVGAMASRRVNAFNDVFPDAIDLLVRGLKSGLPVSESVNAVGREMSGPVGQEFRRVTDAVRFGQPLEDALWEVSNRLGVAEFKFFVISLSVQKDTGGNLAETLGNLSDILRKRRQMKLKVRAMSSEAKASAMILGGLPFLMFAIIYALAPDYESMLFTDPRGKLLLGVGAGIMTVGILVMRKMVRFEI